MRLWLLVAFLAATVLADHPRIDSEKNYELAKSVFKSWKNHLPVRYIDEEEHEHEEKPRRTKRSAMSMAAEFQSNKLGADKSCQTPGYTGEFCEYPICGVNNPGVPDIPDTDGLGATIDMAYLRNCTQEYVVLVDDMMFSIRFELVSDQALNPQMSLFNDNGELMFPDQTTVTKTETSYTSFYFSLPPGKYKAIPTADLPSTYCTLTVRARTQLTVVGGFIEESEDAARSDYPIGFVFQDQASTAVFHANQMRSPAKLITVTFTGPDNTIYRPRMLNTRYNCSYEYFYETFTCRTLGSYTYHIEGVTFEGYNFRRTYSFMCMPAPPTSPTPTPTLPGPVTGCKNNGFLITNTNSSQYCYCQGLWTGTDCSQIICMNGGTVDEANKCRCKSGFQGNHCQDVVCSDNKGLEFDALHPTLTLVLRVRAGMNNVNGQIMNATKTLVDKLQFDPDYLTNYILVLFNNNKIIHNERYTSSVKLLNDLQNIAITSTSPEGDCYDSVFTALSTALTQYPNNKSPVYVVTDAPPKDVEVAETVFHQDSFWRAPIHFIFVQPEPICPLTPEDAAYRKMDDIAKRSGGQTFYLNRNSVYDFTSQHMLNTIYRSQLMLSNDVQVCMSQNAYQTITIDTTVQQVTVVATGQHLTLLVTDPSGSLFTRIDSAYDDEGNYIWSLNGVQSGMWSFQVQTNHQGSACTYKIFQKLYNNIAGMQQAQFDLFWAFTPAIDMNGYDTQPIYGFEQGIVAKLTNYPMLLPQYVTAGMNIYASRDGKQVEVYASNGIWRDACDYTFYFPPFTCTKPNEILYFNFYARDDYGMAIQRAGNMYCSEIAPTLQPPGDCQNGGVATPSNSSCYCPLGYTGTRCEQIQCFNGGTTLGSKCLCVQGWTGTFCEMPRCTQKGDSPEPLLKYVDMVFAVEFTIQSSGHVIWLNERFADLLRDITSQDPRWIHRFVLTAFNSTWADVIAVAPSTDPRSVINALNDLAQQYYGPNSNSIDAGCDKVQAFKAFDVAILKRDAAPGSYMQLFMASSPDNSEETNGWDQLYEFQRSMNLHINVYLGVSSRFATPENPAGYYCNATYMDFYWLNAITASAAGGIYPIQQGSTPDMLQTIPNQYYSSIVFTRYDMDCSDGVQYYFPIDAYVQTIQLEIYGSQPEVTLYDGEGNVYPQQVLVNDKFASLMISEVRKGCDDGWREQGQYCYYVHQDDRVSWPEAQAFCHSAGGQLADDMTEDKHNWLKGYMSVYEVWFGLFNNNGTGWAWDRPNGVDPLKLDQTNVYWSTKGPSPDDPNYPCVFWDGNRILSGDANSWTPAECGERRWFLCQKHRYDQSFHPENLEYDDLPDGKWYINVKTTPSASNPYKYCGATVRVQSELQIFTGYAQQIYQDTPDNDPYKDSKRNRLITYIHSQDNDYRDPILFQAYITDAYNATFYNAARYEERLSCAYPWVSQTFDCPNAQQDGNEFMITHAGEDSFGNMFQRITFGHCSRQPLTCGNGGVRWNGLCICDEYWQGSMCTIPICVNNGTLSDDNKSCKCPAGFTGFNCQYEMCDAPISFTFHNTDKTLILVVENTLQNQKAIQNLADGFSSIMASVNPRYFYNFALIVFDSNGVKSMRVTDNSEDIPNMLRALTQTDQGSCTMPLYSAIFGLFNDKDLIMEVQWPNSEMLLITSAGANDENIRRQDLMTLSDYRYRLHYLYISDNCGDTPSDGSLTNLVRTAYTSNGNVAFMPSGNLTTFLTAYLPTRFGSNTLTNPTGHLNFTCPPGNNWLVQVDSNTTDLYVTTSSEIASLGGLDPYGNVVSPDPLYMQGNTKLYHIKTEGAPGIYKLTFVSYGYCYASIYSVGGAQVTALYAVTTDSNPTGSRQDGANHSPIAFVQNVITAHLEGAKGHRGQLQYAEIFDVDTQQIILRSELYPRNGPIGVVNDATCQFEYVSDPFTCDSDLLAVFIYGMDENYNEFRRQSVAYCLNSTAGQVTSSTTISSPLTTTSAPMTSTTSQTTGSPTTTGTTLSPTTSYGNANLVFDVVFLVDVSQSAKDLYDQMSKFIQTLMLSYTINSNVHVGLVPVLGDSDLGPVSYTLSTITSQNGLVKYLNEMKSEFSDFDDQGQFLQQALSTTINVNYMNDGYRNTIKNHLIIYITATTDFSDNPSTASILSQNAYGVITIGYGPGATDMQKLSNLAGGAGCAFSAADVTALNMATLSGVKDLIWKADGNGGLYCGNAIGN